MNLKVPKNKNSGFSLQELYTFWTFFRRKLKTVSKGLAAPAGIRGFTLIEMMVSIAIFAIVMTISMGALLNVIDINRKSQAVKTIMNNLSFALEGMAKDIRFGNSYQCTTVPLSSISNVGDCLPGETGLAFIFKGARDDPAGSGRVITYYTVPNIGGTSGCPDSTFTILRAISTGGVLTPGVAVTADDACIENLTFRVSGQETSGGNLSGGLVEQPRVFITLNGYSGTGKSKTPFNLQTTISERQLDVQP